MQKQLLTNVSIIRPLLIVLLVFYHAFAIYSGAWNPITDFPEVKVYWWLDKLSYAFMLETFVFLSGYVFGYQVRIKGNGILEAKKLFYSKFKRLMIPGMVFSLIYNILFCDIIHQPVSNTLYNVVAGTGHLWFLPMLFWCFVLLWLFEKIQLKPIVLIPLLLIVSILPTPLPFHLGHTLSYMIFFYVGYVLQKKDIKLSDYYTKRNTFILITTFIILFPILTLFVQQLNNQMWWDNMLTTKVLRIVVCNISKLIYSSIGVLMTLVIVGLYEKKRTTPLKNRVIIIGELCMGVYILQQFFLKAMYYYTELPFLIGPYWLPWVGFCVTLLGSVLLSWILRQTKLGRILIG